MAMTFRAFFEGLAQAAPQLVQNYMQFTVLQQQEQDRAFNRDMAEKEFSLKKDNATAYNMYMGKLGDKLDVETSTSKLDLQNKMKYDEPILVAKLEYEKTMRDVAKIDLKTKGATAPDGELLSIKEARQRLEVISAQLENLASSTANNRSSTALNELQSQISITQFIIGASDPQNEAFMADLDKTDMNDWKAVRTVFNKHAPSLNPTFRQASQKTFELLVNLKSEQDVAVSKTMGKIVELSADKGKREELMKLYSIGKDGEFIPAMQKKVREAVEYGSILEQARRIPGLKERAEKDPLGMLVDLSAPAVEESSPAGGAGFGMGARYGEQGVLGYVDPLLRSGIGVAGAVSRGIGSTIPQLGKAEQAFRSTVGGAVQPLTNVENKVKSLYGY